MAAAHLETRLVEAQLQALQRQLHPHFLFNTLQAISVGAGGDYDVGLHDGRHLGLSRLYKDALQERLAKGT